MNLKVNFKIIQENQINEQHLYPKSGDVLHQEPLQTENPKIALNEAKSIQNAGNHCPKPSYLIRFHNEVSIQPDPLERRQTYSSSSSHWV